MSTKIYNGFVIAPWNATIGALHALVQDFRAQVKPLAQAHTASVIFENAIREWDRRAIGYKPREEKSSPMSYAWLHHVEEQRKIEKTGYRNPRYDVGFDMSLFPHPDGRILGQTYTEREEWHEMWLRQPGVSEYAYYNNTDRPDSISEADWGKRRADWTLVLLEQGAGVPRDCSFQASISANDTWRPPKADDLLERIIPSVTARARNLAVDRVIADLQLKDMQAVIGALGETGPNGRLAPAIAKETEAIAVILDPHPTYAKLTA